MLCVHGPRQSTSLPERSTPAAGWSSPTCCRTRSRCSAAGTTRRTRPGCTSPTPWSSRPSPQTSPRRPGWCCSRACPRTASSSTPTPAPARAPSWPATRGSRCSSRGTRSSARSASTAPPPCSRGREVDAYFAVRPRGSQLGAWASHQSSVVSGREELLAAYDDAERRYADGEVPTPEEWGGYLVHPESVEFWQGRPGRMHDRLVYRRSVDSGPDGWRTERLAP